ncbi:unnamed protein product, partial [Closterium sp. Naga37s-1]
SHDVVDLLPGHVWHIIFRCLLQPPADPAKQQQKQEYSISLEEASLRGELSSLCDFVALQQHQSDSPDTHEIEEDNEENPLSAREQHEKDSRRFGSSWHVLRFAMASKRLLHHVFSFS